jgi:hypothetical protein
LLLSYLPFIDSIVHQYCTNLPETTLDSAANFLSYNWDSHFWKIPTQIRWLAQLAVFQFFDDVFYNYKSMYYRLGLLLPMLFMNGGIKTLLIFAAIFAVTCLIWKFKGKLRPAEYIAEAVFLAGSIWLYPAPALFSCIAAIIFFVDTIARFRPTLGLMAATRVILFSAIGITIALVFWQ